MIHVKILWIDDSESWAKSTQENLELISAKYKVKFHFINAINGEEIIHQCAIFNFDLIVMDYDMKPYSGEKYIQDVRNEDHLENIQILFYSQNNSVNLDSLIKGLKNVTCIYRPNLEDKIKDLFFYN